MAQQNFQDWYNKAMYACESGRSYLASPCLALWDQMMTLVPASLPQGDLVKLKEKLLFTAFCDLPIGQAAEVIEKRLLNFVGSDVDISDALKTRFIFVGYGNENRDREVLREAALHNQQSLGGKKVFEWLQFFDKAFPPDGTEEAAAGKFFTQYPDVMALSKTEQLYLKRLLQVYDEWLRVPLMNSIDAAVIYKKLDELEKAGVKEIDPDTFEQQYLTPLGGKQRSISQVIPNRSVPTPQGSVSLPLLQALSKYENLGNQLITRERIKVKSQVEPVRPSLFYWLKCYRDELGIGQHNSVERGNFLFRSENGRKLSAEERERIDLILKSVEENLPLSIDAEHQEIVFPTHYTERSVTGKSGSPSETFNITSRVGNSEDRALIGRAHSQGTEMPIQSLSQEKSFSKVSVAPVASAQANFTQNQDRTFSSFTQQFQPNLSQNMPSNKEEKREVYQTGGMRIAPNIPSQFPQRETVAPVSSGNMSFSAKHIFPAEKEMVTKNTEEVKAGAPIVPRPAVQNVPQPQSNPFNIHPVSRGREEE